MLHWSLSHAIYVIIGTLLMTQVVISMREEILEVITCICPTWDSQQAYKAASCLSIWLNIEATCFYISKATIKIKGYVNELK